MSALRGGLCVRERMWVKVGWLLGQLAVTFQPCDLCRLLLSSAFLSVQWDSDGLPCAGWA